MPTTPEVPFVVTVEDPCLPPHLSVTAVTLADQQYYVSDTRLDY